MITMSHKMKQTDPKRWSQLQNAEKVSLSCTHTDMEGFLAIHNISLAKTTIKFLINQHLRFRLHIDDYRKEIIHLKLEKDKIIASYTNEIRKKMLVIQSLNKRVETMDFAERETSRDASHDLSLTADNNLEADLADDVARKQSELDEQRELESRNGSLNHSVLQRFCSPAVPTKTQSKVNMESRVSVQLTPFHTPSISFLQKEKAKSASKSTSSNSPL